MVCSILSVNGISAIFLAVGVLLTSAATLYGFPLHFQPVTQYSTIGFNNNGHDCLVLSSSKMEDDDVQGAQEGGTTSRVQRKQVPLSSGVTAEVALIRDTSITEDERPPLVFIHGSFHSSWCWEKYYLPFFAQRGFKVVCALSLRGTNGTWAGPGVTKVKIHQHVDDVVAFLHWLNDATNNITATSSLPPVLIGHSFGGLTIMKYLERMYSSSGSSTEDSSVVVVPALSGCCVACSVPPSGMSPMTLRYLRRNLIASYKLTVGFALKKVLTNKLLCRELFFGDDDSISEEELEEIQGRFAQDSTAMIDLMDMNKALPSKMVLSNDGGKVSFARQLPPSLVIGASDDYVVDRQGVVETAQYFGVEPTWVDSPHDIMLGTKWINGANAIWKWLNDEIVGS